MPHAQLVRMCHKASEQDYLTHLNDIAHNVRGNWVIRSSFVCGDDEHLAACRDYLLLLFTEQEFINRKEFREAVGLSAETTKDLLQTLADARRGKVSSEHAHRSRSNATTRANGPRIVW